jgi:DNA-binding NarL/FixJ family response regulator
MPAKTSWKLLSASSLTVTGSLPPRVERSRYSISGFGHTAPEAGEPLTTREQQVLEKLAAGANKMIARDLHMSLATAKFHVGSLLAKLGARNRTDAVAIGLKLGILLL